MITELKSNQVFVFGTNSSGFHGAGAAGFAFCGSAANDWRTCPLKQAAIYSNVGSKERIGKWCVWGIAKGLMVGTDGMSYGVVTIDKPGKKRSIPITHIKHQIMSLSKYALAHPEFEFLVTNLGTGYAGYTQEEMDREVWGKVWLPENVKKI